MTPPVAPDDTLLENGVAPAWPTLAAREAPTGAPGDAQAEAGAGPDDSPPAFAAPASAGGEGSGARRSAAAHLLTMLAAVTLWGCSLATVDPADMSDAGLITVLGPLFWAGVGVLTVGFVAGLRRRPPTGVMPAYLVALVVMLHGLPGFVEDLARFPTAWLHAGYVEYIVRTGDVLPDFDARFNWPGAFSFAALLTGLSGVASPTALMRWTPVVLNALFLLPLASLAQVATGDRRARWAALWLFSLASWVGQDYFAPQALTYFLYLTILAVLLRWFRAPARPASTGDSLRAVLAGMWRRVVVRSGATHGASEPSNSAGPAQRVALLLLVLVVCLTIVVSHQLTPFMLFSATVAVIVAGRVQLRGLPLLMCVGAVVWISFGAEAYWRGHLDFLTGGLGNVGGIVDENVSQRMEGSAGHQLVLQGRGLLTAVLAGLALCGFARGWWRGRAPWAFAALAASPLPAVALQGYGGELFLRVFFFSVPFLAILAAQAFFPGAPRASAGFADPGRRVRRGGGVVPFALVALALVPLFVVARYGNERFEQIYPADLEAVDWVYANAEPGSTVLTLNFVGPWRYRALEQFDVQWLHEDVPRAGEVRKVMAAGRPSAYLLLTEGQAAYGEIVAGQPDGWMDRFEDDLLRQGTYCPVYDNGDARVLRWNPEGERFGRRPLALQCGPGLSASESRTDL